MSQVAIRTILTTALASWASPRGMEIAREGHAFEKSDDFDTFLELTLIPDDTQVATLSGVRRRYTGTVVINIWTKDDIGTGDAEGWADEIATSLFPVVPKNYLPVSVETPPSVKRAIVDGGWRITPVVFTYRAEY